MNWEERLSRLALQQVGVSRWKWGAFSSEAPLHVDCSSFTQWIFSRAGIWLPRRPYQQYEYCSEQGRIMSIDEVRQADLLFTNCPCAENTSGEPEPIEHVCMAVSSEEVICATNSELGRGVVRLSLEKLLSTRVLRGAGRIYL